MALTEFCERFELGTLVFSRLLWGSRAQAGAQGDSRGEFVQHEAMHKPPDPQQYFFITVFKQVPKPERKAKAAEFLHDVKPSRDDLYLPVNANARVLDVIAESATPMQSAAKVLAMDHTCGEASRISATVPARQRACACAGCDCRECHAPCSPPPRCRTPHVRTWATRIRV